jgi:hypothetical protein
MLALRAICQVSGAPGPRARLRALGRLSRRGAALRCVRALALQPLPCPRQLRLRVGGRRLRRRRRSLSAPFATQLLTWSPLCLPGWRWGRRWGRRWL